MTGAVASGMTQPDALSAGFERGMLVAAGLGVLNLLVGAVRAPRIKPDPALVGRGIALSG